ncbi:MAG: BMP family lipoprotein [Fusobacteriaceae bacterium]
MKKIIFGLLLISFTIFGENIAKVGLVMSAGGLGSGFNKMAYEALMKLKNEGKINDFKYVEPSNPAEDVQFLKDFSSGDFDLVIGMGTGVAQGVLSVQKYYPNQRYVVVGAVNEIPNTITTDFAEHEASFLAGTLAGLMSKNNVVGTVPALDTKSFNRFVNGFSQGAKYVKPEITVLNTYMPTSSTNPFNDPVTAKNISLVMSGRGADVIFHIAENSGMGVFETARQNGFYAIGCDEDEDGKVPGTILSSVRIRIDNAIYNIVDNINKTGFESGYRMLGLEEGAVSLTDFRYTEKIIGEENLKKLKEIEGKIISGEIKVTE